MPNDRWDVYHFFCHQIQPEPKDKFVVVAYLEANWFFGLFINSQINPFYQKRPQLLPCMVPIAQAQHSAFLTHDSYVDCTAVNTYPVSNLTQENYRGSLHSDAVAGVLSGIRACKVIKQIHKNLLLT